MTDNSGLKQLPLGKTAIVDEVGNVAKVDSLGYLIAVRVEHYKVHLGTFYTVTDYDADVDNASPKYWHIITPNTIIRIHIKIAVAVDAPGLIQFYENPTTTGNGTIITAYNNDRNSSNIATCVHYYDPTVSNDGTLIEAFRIGAGGKQKIGGDARQFAELILKQNEQYLIKFTPDSDNAEVTFNSQFYEN